MGAKTIQKLIDRVVGTEGILRIPSWWMHKILSDLVQYCDSLESSDAGIKEYLESQLNLVGDAIEALDARVSEVESHELFAIVSELPAEPKENTIYLVPSANGDGNNILTEWVYVNDAWEQFGEFKADVDLSGYVKKEEGKGLSANDYTDEDKEKVSSLENYDDTEIKNKLTELSEDKEDKANKVTALSDESTDNQYPSAKCVHDSLSSLAEEIASNGVLIEDLQNMKIDKENDDYYPNMAVGLADNLAGVDVVDSEINFRRSGGGAISDGVARIESIKGNSVVWNQKWSLGVRQGVIDNSDGTTPKYDSLGFCPWYTTAINGHKILTIANDKEGLLDKIYWNDLVQHDVRGGIIYEANIKQTTTASLTAKCPVGAVANYNVTVVFYDLTQMFEAGNEPTTIEEFYARIPMGVDMNAYNEGEVIHMDVQSIESVGVNAWDEEWESGGYDTETGNKTSGANFIRSANYIPVFGGSTYYFTGISGKTCYAWLYGKEKNFIRYTSVSSTLVMPKEVAYMMIRLGSTSAPIKTYNHDVCINLSDASINGKYFPYIKRVEDLSLIRKYFPDGMKSAGTAHDEIRNNTATGKREKVVRIGEVDMGTLNWTKASSGSVFYTTINDLKWVTESKLGLSGNYSKMLCSKYVSIGSQSLSSASEIDKSLSSNSIQEKRVQISDTSYTDAATFKAAMSGVMLYYELAEPIVFELDEADQFKDLDYQVWNGGTEKAIAEGKSAPLAADITYGFNAIGKIKELEEAIKALQTTVASL